MRMIIYGLIFLCFLYSCNTHNEKTSPVIKNITESVYGSGIVKTDNQYEVFSTVTGTIDKILVTENDLVKAGTPLMIVSNETSRINRENALLAANYAGMDVNADKLTDLRNNIELARSKLSNDSALFIRQQNLWAQHIGSRVDLEQKELAYKNSQTALASAKIKYNDLLQQLTFNARQSKNNLDISKKNESDFTVKSSINGKVYSLYKKAGEMVSPQIPLALVGDPVVFLLELQVDEYDIAKIKTGQQVLVTMDSYKGSVFTAKVSKIYPLMSEHSKSFTVEAVFVNQPPVLYPNLTVEANIIIQSKEKALLIPRSYLVKDSFVLIKKDEQKKIVPGLKDYQQVEIVSGLTANDVIYKPQ
jgi:HlyD family secretion protein